MNKEIKAMAVARLRALLRATVAQARGITDGEPLEFDAKGYSDIIAITLVAFAEMNKTSFWLANDPSEPFLAHSRFLSEFDTFAEILSEQDAGFNWRGMYGPRSVRSDLASTLGKVSGALAKANLATDVENALSSTRQLAQA